jgi:hypothetical protein
MPAVTVSWNDGSAAAGLRENVFQFVRKEPRRIAGLLLLRILAGLLLHCSFAGLLLLCSCLTDILAYYIIFAYIK